MVERNVAVVGCGHWGKNLVRNFFELDALKLICDKDESTLKRLSDQFAGTQTCQATQGEATNSAASAATLT